ncbi:nuclear transport factor 2 family protein [Noviherbaspirillum album]|nr:nuclear transport factor 2 family protein [Noviherbaspirillum sp. CPCC 100848]
MGLRNHGIADSFTRTGINDDENNMYSFELCRKYQEAINRGNLEQALTLFADEATVNAPLTGQSSARKFHEWLLGTTKETITRLKHVFQSLDSSGALAMQLHYTWVLSNGKTLEFEGVMIFEFTADRMSICKLTIIYDTEPIRTHVSQSALAAIR